MRFRDSAIKWIQGLPFGSVWPKRPTPKPPPFDGRSCALSVLRKYLSELTFYVPGAFDENTGTYGEAQPFRICEDNIFTEMPDAMESASLPSIAFLPGKAQYAVIGLCTYLDETTRDKFGKGSVIQWQSEFTETFTLELWARDMAQRRAIIAGLEVSLTPTEYMYGIRFLMPTYFNESVCFTLQSRTNIEDGDAAKGKRKVQLEIEMRFNVVALVNYEPVTPAVVVDPLDSEVLETEVV